MTLDNVIYILFLCGPIFSLAGFIMLKLPPKKVNWLYGYRTPLSMKNRQNWVFAQRYSARKMMLTGLVMFILSFVGIPLQLSESANLLVGMFILLSSVGVLFYSCESAIKKFESKNKD